MRDPDFVYKLKRVTKVWREVRIALQTKHPGLDISDVVLRGMGKEKLRLVMDEVGVAFFWEYFLRDNTGGKSGAPADKSDDEPYLDLDETFVIIERDKETGRDTGQHHVKGRGDLTKADMIQIRKQKVENIRRNEAALDDWDWECRLIWPVLDAHSDWIYRQAFDVVCTELGEVPTPPSRRKK